MPRGVFYIKILVEAFDFDRGLIVLNTKNFKCFQVVYEERNITAAANKLFLSPQGLSKIIKSLEDECGTALFVRSKDGLQPTESGKLFYEKSGEVLRDLNEMFSSIEALGQKDKRFKLGFALGTIRTVDIKAIHEFMEERPEIVGSWQERSNETVYKAVINGDISFGFAIGKPKDKCLKGVCIKSNEVVLYVYKGHRLWDKEEVSLSDIKNEKIISMNKNFRIYEDIVNACRLQEFQPDIVAMVGEGESIKQLVKNKVGIGISPDFLTEDKDVRAIKIRDAYTWDIYGIFREDSPDIQLAEELVARLKK